MPQLINNRKFKLFIFFLILFFLSTFNNYKLKDIYEDYFTVKTFNIYGLEENLRNQVYDNLSPIINKNIFSIDKQKIYKIMGSYNFIDEYFVKKRYPSEVNLYFKHTNFIANSDISNFVLKY